MNVFDCFIEVFYKVIVLLEYFNDIQIKGKDLRD